MAASAAGPATARRVATAALTAAAVLATAAGALGASAGTGRATATGTVAQAEEDADVAITRLAGDNRFVTAAELSRARFDPDVEAAYVATGTDFADALTGGVAAARNGAPMLLVTAESVPQATLAELDRLDPDGIVVLGGETAVGEAVEAELAAHSDEPVQRLAGADRFATAAEVARATFDEADAVFVGTGSDFPDGLAGAPAAAQAGGPLLLAADDTLPEATTAELDRLDPDRIVVLGGASAVSEAAADELAAYGQVDRLAGRQRFETAALVANELADPDHAYVATGGDFADALAAGAVAGAENAPVLLTGADRLPTATGDALEAIAPAGVTIMGGAGAVADAVEQQLRWLLIDDACLADDLLVGGPDGITTVDGCQPEVMFDDAEVATAVADGDGGVVFQHPLDEDSPAWPQDAIRWLPADADEPEAVATAAGPQADPVEILHLHDVAVVDGEPTVMATRATTQPGTDQREVVLELHGLASGERHEVGEVGGWESGPARVSYAGGPFALAMVAEGFTWLRFVDADGDDVDVAHNPAPEACPEGSDPEGERCLNTAVATDDGGQLAWVESDGFGGGRRELVVADLDSGGETGRWLLDSELPATELDFDGDRAVISGRSGEALRVLDLATGILAPADVAAPDGTARLR